MPKNNINDSSVSVGTGKYSPTLTEVTQDTSHAPFGEADYDNIQASFPNSPVNSASPDTMFVNAAALFSFFKGAVFNRGDSAEGLDLFDPTNASGDFSGNSTLASTLKDFGTENVAPNIGESEAPSPSDAQTNPPPATMFYPNQSSPTAALPANHVQGTATETIDTAARSSKTFGSGDGSSANPVNTGTSISERL